MKPISAVAIYLLIWTLSLFLVLPWGIRTADEANEKRVDGQADSAPSHPLMWRKVAWTTLISALIFGLFWLNYVNGWLTLDSVPVEWLGLKRVTPGS